MLLTLVTYQYGDKCTNTFLTQVKMYYYSGGYVALLMRIIILIMVLIMVLESFKFR